MAILLNLVKSLVVTAHNTSVSEEISVFAAWSTGNDQDYYNCRRRFGCREIKVPSAPIFLNTVYRFITA